MRISKIVIGLAAIIAGVFVIMGSCMRSKPSGDVGGGPAEGDAIDVLATDNRFHPSTIEAPAGRQVTVQIENTGDAAHEFRIEALDLNTGTIEGGTTAHATFVVPAGTTEFVCSYHSGMAGRIEADR